MSLRCHGNGRLRGPVHRVILQGPTMLRLFCFGRFLRTGVIAFFDSSVLICPVCGRGSRKSLDSDRGGHTVYHIGRQIKNPIHCAGNNLFW